jgi:hypothetical protein
MRTRLRGLEIAGIQMGIEVPENYEWEWPGSPVAEFVCLPREPEVHIGLRVCEITSADLGGERYGLGDWTFEVASRGGDWLLGLSCRGVREQIATFDRDFRAGEILVSHDTAGKRRFPLRTPIDEWIVLHRTVARGGLCVNGSIRTLGGPVSVRLGRNAAPPSRDRWATHHRSLLGRDTVLLRESGSRLRSFATPWNQTRESTPGGAPPVADLTVVEEAPKAFRECLDVDEAAEILVTHAVVPLCDENLLDRVLHNARQMAEHTKVLRRGEVAETAAPIAWESAQLQNAFAPPSSAI